MSRVAIAIPDHVLLATRQSPEKFVREAKFLLAFHLFEQGRLSAGIACQLCGLGRVDFLLVVSRQGIPVADRDDEEAAKEFAPCPAGSVVTNSEPIVALSAVGRLDLLPALFESVLVPAAVFREVAGAGLGRPGANELRRAAWARVVDVEPSPGPPLSEELGPGEAETIALAARTGASLALLDDRRARRAAEDGYGVGVKGVAGLLLEGKRRRILPSVRPLLDRMLAEGYRLSPRLIDHTCREAGE
ncbi:MAG: UPF0175 family protein [Deltaproteobacteria bacterium]|nr:UPF0175 family protein [Deltaproteobacteria bacterium]